VISQAISKTIDLRVAEGVLHDGWILLPRSRAAQNARRAEILIDLGPMNAVAFADQFPVVSLIGIGMKQPWVPD
jgi:hypothetical protein